MSKPVTQTVSPTVLSKVLMITERRIQQLASEGILAKEDRGKYPLIPNVQAYIKFWQDRAVGSDAGQTDLHTERTRLTKAQADKTELEADVLKGDLIPADEVFERWETMVAGFRAKMLSIPTKTSHLLINVSVFDEVESILKTHVYEALKELSDEGNRQNIQSDI